MPRGRAKSCPRLTFSHTHRGVTSRPQDQEAELDAQIASVVDALRGVTEHPANKPYLYVSDADITSLPCFTQVRGRAC